MNSVCLVGRLTRDPEMRNTDSGNNCANFSVAVQRNFKNKDGEYEADFINCVAWGKTAEFIEKYFKKGQFIGINGRIQTRKWLKDDETRYATDVVASDVTFTAGKSDNGYSVKGKPSNTSNDSQFSPLPDGGDFMPAMADDELPF